MNKAFVKEQDDLRDRCPRCESRGVAVLAETITAFVRPEFRAEIGRDGFFCDYAPCDVVFFDAFDRAVTTEQLVRPVWPKDPTAPLCGCFGLTADDVEADIREGSVARVKEAVARSKSAAACCLTKSPTGQSCAAVVQRYYFKLRGGGPT
jgi:hypothetical protein